jgi:hypothetical protein
MYQKLTAEAWTMARRALALAGAPRPPQAWAQTQTSNFSPRISDGSNQITDVTASLRATIQCFESEYLKLVDAWKHDAANIGARKRDLDGLIGATGELGRSLIDAVRCDLQTTGTDNRRCEAAGRAYLATMSAMSDAFNGLDPTARRLFDAVELSPKEQIRPVSEWRAKIRAAFKESDS